MPVVLIIPTIANHIIANYDNHRQHILYFRHLLEILITKEEPTSCFYYFFHREKDLPAFFTYTKMNIENNLYFTKALEFIKTNDLNSLASGKHIIDGDNLWVNIVDADHRDAKDAKFEAHNKYIDIQIPLSANEQFGVKLRKACTQPIGEFNDADDYILFDDEIETIETVNAGEMIVFTPDMAHAPLIGKGKIHKAIFKVLVIDL